MFSDPVRARSSQNYSSSLRIIIVMGRGFLNMLVLDQ